MRFSALKALLPAFALLVSAAWTQEFRASVQGTVTDPSGAAVPGARLVLRNTETATERTAVSDGQGLYLISMVPPGTYTLSVSAAGFKTFERAGIVLNMAQAVDLAVQLELGASQEKVTVTGEIAGVETQSSTLGGVVRQDIVANLPLKGHSSYMLFTLSPGVVWDRYQNDERPNDQLWTNGYKANGAPVGAGDMAVDGASQLVNLVRGGANLATFSPPTESIAEFKMQSGILPAEYGFSGVSIRNIVTKSGTNEPHGSAFEYYRNAALNANTFFARGAGKELAPFSYHTFGGTFGGPVFLPKLYDGRNRTFFFFSYDGARHTDAWDTTISVPTMKMRAGDFSEIPATIYNPLSLKTVDGVPTREPFAGKQIPVQMQDPVARKILSYYPEPNLSASSATPWVSNFNYAQPRDRWWNNYIVKLDHQFSPRHLTYARINTGQSFLDFGHYWDGIATPLKNSVYRPNNGLIFNHSFILSPQTMINWNVGYAYGNNDQTPISDGFDITSLGFPASMRSIVQRPTFPVVDPSGFTDRPQGGNSIGGGPIANQPGYTYTFQGNLSRMAGRHTLKAGGESRIYRTNYYAVNYPSGRYVFGTAQTGGPRADTPLSSSGSSIASMLVGFGSSGGIDWNTALSIQSVNYAAYVQDDFRATSKLTLNYGLRYEYQVPMTERYNRTNRGWAYGRPFPLQVTGLSLTGGLQYAGADGQPRGLYEPDSNNLSPRFGFAYKLDGKTALRGGYSLQHIPRSGTGVQPLGFSITTPWVTSTDGLTPKNLLSNPFPEGRLEPVGSSAGPLGMLGQAVTFVEPADRLPRFQIWTFNVQRDLPGLILVELGYVGSKGNGLLGASGEQLNQLDPKYLSMGTALLANVPNPFYGIIKTGSLSGKTVQRQQLLLPYPQFTSVVRESPAFVNSTYHSMQVRIDKRLSGGFSATGSYTLSKTISDDASPQNAYDRLGARAIDGGDRPHRLTYAAVWELPFGKGRRFMGTVPRALDLLAGGWTLSGTGTYQSGAPQGISLQTPTIYGANMSQWPLVVGDPKAVEPTLNRYFDTTAFQQPANFSFGNVSARISSVRAPALILDDLMLSKRFQINERFNAEFRAAAYNFLNHPVFAAPNRSLGNANFGRVTTQANFGREFEFWFRLGF